MQHGGPILWKVCLKDWAYLTDKQKALMNYADIYVSVKGIILSFYKYFWWPLYLKIISLFNTQISL